MATNPSFLFFNGFSSIFFLEGGYVEKRSRCDGGSFQARRKPSAIFLFSCCSRFVLVEKWKKMDHFSVGTQSFRFFVAASDSGCHWPARVTGFFTEFSSSSIRGRRVFIGFSQLALSLAEFYWVLPSFTGFHLVFLGFTGFWSSLTGFYLVLLGFI